MRTGSTGLFSTSGYPIFVDNSPAESLPNWIGRCRPAHAIGRGPVPVEFGFHTIWVRNSGSRAWTFPRSLCCRRRYNIGAECPEINYLCLLMLHHPHKIDLILVLQLFSSWEFNWMKFQSFSSKRLLWKFRILPLGFYLNLL